MTEPHARVSQAFAAAEELGAIAQVLLFLISRGDRASPVKLIAKRTGRDRRTVQRAIVDIERLGWCRTERSGRSAKRYIFPRDKSGAATLPPFGDGEGDRIAAPEAAISPPQGRHSAPPITESFTESFSESASRSTRTRAREKPILKSNGGSHGKRCGDAEVGFGGDPDAVRQKRRAGFAKGVAARRSSAMVREVAH